MHLVAREKQPPPPAPLDREETAYFDTLFKDTLKVTRKIDKDEECDASEVASEVARDLFERWRADHSYILEETRFAIIGKAVSNAIREWRKQDKARDIRQRRYLDREGVSWGREDGVSVILDETLPDARLREQQVRRMYEETLAGMGEKHRRILILDLEYEWSHQMIAKEVGLDVTTVRCYLTAARNQLRRVAARYIAGEPLPRRIGAAVRKELI